MIRQRAEDEDDDRPLDLKEWLLKNVWHRYGAACCSSAIVHTALLVALGFWLLPGLAREEIQELVATLDNPLADKEKEVIQEQLIQQDVPASATSESTIRNVASVNTLIGANGAVEAMATPQVQTKPSESVAESHVAVSMTNVFRTNNRKLGQGLPKGVFGDPLAFASNNSEAVDRIGQEIAGKLSKSKVLVIWCFDQSESMRDDREEIMSRVNNMYAEMTKNLSSLGSDAVLSVVTSYGQSFAVQTPTPTRDIEVIKEAMASVPVDPSGYEMQCQAVSHSINSFRAVAKSGHRQIVLVMCTDESGNPQENMGHLETAIAEAKASDCSIYVIGREAVFGYPIAHMNWNVTVTVPGTDRKVSRHFVLPIDRGPETPFVEQLQTDGFGKRKDAHPSGFGSYEQARMARETGGIFFLLPSPEIGLFHRDTRKYDARQMRGYMPDLSTRDDYSAERMKNPIRAALWQVINDLNPYNPERAGVLEMRMVFAPDAPTFLSQVRGEQNDVTMYMNYLAIAEKVLGSMERERSREAAPRWQANYDLIYAQMPAYRARMYEYAAYLEAFVQFPKVAPIKPGLNHVGWQIQTRTQTITGEVTAGIIKEATARFRKVIELHPGTPWAARAQDELDRGFGVELFPLYHPPPGGGGNMPTVNIPTPKL